MLTYLTHNAPSEAACQALHLSSANAKGQTGSYSYYGAGVAIDYVRNASPRLRFTPGGY